MQEEVLLWLEKWNHPYSKFAFLWLVERYPEYRSLLYYRMRSLYTKVLSRIYKGQTTLYICVKDKIGRNCIIWHGFSTIINAQSIGDDYEIWQQVTIGNKFNFDGPKPRIGNNVKICAGAIIVGDVTIGDNSIVGAGALVTKNVPANCVVGGGPFKILKKI